MSKTKKLGKKFAAFVNQLSPDECREQLVLAYLQMEKCMQVLRGMEVKPVAMKDNGESSDLELFYMCKKVREELSTQEQENDTISIAVDFACDDAIKKCKRLRKEIENLHVLVNECRVHDSAVEYLRELALHIS